MEKVTKNKPYGYEVTVRYYPSSGKPDETFHYRGCTEHGARHKGLLKSCADSIVSVIPLTEKEWIGAYGRPEVTALSLPPVYRENEL
jgi:hypothetical protein